MLYFQEMLGIAVFSITGVLAIKKADVDLFGAVVLGIITAIGGGTLSGPAAGSSDLLDCRLQLHLGRLVCCTAGVFPDKRITTTISPAALSRWPGSGIIRVGGYRESAGSTACRAIGRDDGRADQHWRRHSTDVLAGRVSLLHVTWHPCYAPILLGCTLYVALRHIFPTVWIAGWIALIFTFGSVHPRYLQASANASHLFNHAGIIPRSNTLIFRAHPSRHS